MTLEDFHYTLGQTIMYCQIIENDVKLIYAAMFEGDMNETLAMIKNKKWTLGKTIVELKKLDFSDEEPYISATDYNYLKQMTEKRNHWCHEAYLQFVYDQSDLKSKEFEKECQKLQRDNERLSSVYKALEKVRLNAMRDFNRL